MKKILFFIALGIAITIYLLQQTQLHLPLWVNNYVNDFLFLPLVLTSCLFVVRKIKQEQTLHLSLLLILSVAFFYSVYFEWYLPQHNPRYTGDWMDCLLYFFGAFIFYVLQHYNSTPSKTNKGQSKKFH
ncbi:hypothetical protein [Myroides odoratus]|uniref:Magnesium citrate secondary transporter n=1 Tax=Myroides odoratus TaxID=256 RepID=A0A9Q6Z3F3_MYROD|nr:hypothetical protein [Myroides odoratus]EHQ43551.1 hypothetical protein Myrod_2730 [Myroides odoratus DSM 2801]EKB05886.1 hypothetical protein HMPREF9716_02595 [Myroides odoratus CIP 103059]QQU00878.1 hypothetical protein I6I88_03715 [Myroides odoratus]WQD56875.1 hypothetical protein U0010_15310 [Myroides odoratus]STZ30828.1 Uncharacterised protein [Myroides odoratus]